ncbi:MAG TPA: restriction endonuclease subunit S, partial [bacterium]|nr:restriction endonuclease subunit S [bacterium]
KKDVAIPEYFRHVIVAKIFIHELGLISPGGAGRNRVLSKKAFLKIKVQMPTVPEQKRIANVLNALDKEVMLLDSYVVMLQRQKTGLMQKLLTGKIRVKV